jgi:hypothetical protein
MVTSSSRIDHLQYGILHGVAGLANRPAQLRSKREVKKFDVAGLISIVARPSKEFGQRQRTSGIA